MKKRIHFTRDFPVSEIRAEERDGEKVIDGYAAVFNSQSEPIAGLFREVIRPGAFTKTLSERDQVALWSHDDSKPLGRRSAGTLVLEQDEHGLRFQVRPGETSWGRDAYIAIQRGDVKGASFRFMAVKEDWSKTESGEDLRELRELILDEVSPVVFPAYRATEVEARSIMEAAGLNTRCEESTDDITSEPGNAHSEAEQREADRLKAMEMELELIEAE